MSRLTAQLAVNLLVALACAVPATSQPRIGNTRGDEIRKLSGQLRWVNATESRDYERTKVSVTQRLLKEVDGLLEETFTPDTATADLVMKCLDSALGYGRGDTRHNVAFFADLPLGHFLLIGVEVPRGGPAIPEDAVSFRAYKTFGDRFRLVAQSNIWDYAIDFYAKQLAPLPTEAELWFLASSIVTPSQAPPMIAIRLYAFDGSSFRTVWVPPDSRRGVCRNCVQADRPREAFKVTPGGFVLNKLFDPTGGAAHSPSVLIHEEFKVNADGLQKSRVWRTGLR